MLHLAVLDIVLVQPQIAPNTGNIMRLCANTGARLHLVRPLGFALSDRLLTRAGLDYRDRAEVSVHPDWPALRAALADRRLLAIDPTGSTRHSDHRYTGEDVLVFGSEPVGLPTAVLAQVPAEHVLRVPMRPGSRSLNLANAVAVVAYEAWSQLGYPGAAPPP